MTSQVCSKWQSPWRSLAKGEAPGKQSGVSVWPTGSKLAEPCLPHMPTALGPVGDGVMGTKMPVCPLVGSPHMYVAPLPTQGLRWA